MRKIALAILFLLATPAFAAEPDAQETVIVTGDALTSIWKIERPSSGEINFFGTAKWGAMRRDYCRFEKVRGNIAMHCMPQGKEGTVDIDGAHIHLAWGTMLARIVLDGTMQSPTQFNATFAIKLSGISINDPEAAHASRIALDEPDAKTVLLRAILAHGPASVSNDASALAKDAFPAEVAGLGQVQAIFDLGHWIKPKRTKAEEQEPDTIFDAYAVEFDSGERVCGLHQRSDGALDGFLCV